ncbi:MAG TPA: hypothetical protein VGS07_29190 [Thermoanaerobaculia bacterium]|jgi:hypothetical protein|nr:hypothetical protein [Thermoanaerobaculia bacterium]
MRLIRTSVVLLVTIVLLAMAVPAQARGLEPLQRAVHSQGGGWLAYSLNNALDNTMTWLARFAGTESPAINRTMKSTTPLPPPTNFGGGPHYVPQTGPCIDPMGSPRCGGI